MGRVRAAPVAAVSCNKSRRVIIVQRFGYASGCRAYQKERADISEGSCRVQRGAGVSFPRAPPYNRSEPLDQVVGMDKKTISIAVIALIMFSHAGSSQVTQPEMTLHSFSSLEVQHAEDGRESRRIAGDAIGIIRVAWPAGTRTTPHNHANELIVLLVEGRMKALSSGREFMMEPGDLVVIPAYVEHGYEALEDSVTLEAAGPG